MEEHNGQDQPGHNSLRRITTGVNGLDTILGGGFLNRATHLFAGMSGTGKTILAQQISYTQAQLGNTVLYLTLLSESHDKMIANLGDLAFFNSSLIGDKLYYLSLYNELAVEGVDRMAAICRENVLKYKAKLVVLDGVSTMRDFAASRGELRKALFNLNTQLSSLGCTVFLLVEDELSPQNAPEFAIADSIIILNNQLVGRRHVRSLEVTKTRATPALSGLHFFDISSAGITIYPRVEALLRQEAGVTNLPDHSKRAAFGIEGLDKMLLGGLVPATINILLGTPGSGKTLSGLRFIYEGARQGETTLILSLQHSPERIMAKAQQLGFDLAPYRDNGSLQIEWVLPVECYLDQVVGRLLEVVARHKPTRLFIDALSDLETLSIHPDNLYGFWAAVTTFLRNRQVTTLGSLEINQIGGGSLVIPERPISVLADTILLMRSLELKGQLRRFVAVLEMRDSDYDTLLREYVISSQSGIQVGAAFESIDAALDGKSPSSNA